MGQGGVAQEGRDGVVEVVHAAVFARRNAGPQALGDEQKPHLIDGGFHRGQLGQDLTALGVFLQHALNTTQLTLGSAQPLNELLTCGGSVGGH